MLCDTLVEITWTAGPFVAFKPLRAKFGVGVAFITPREAFNEGDSYSS